LKNINKMDKQKIYTLKCINPEFVDTVTEKKYKSLDDMVKEEGVEAVLEFLARSPTQIDGYYRHAEMKVVNFTVNKIRRQT
jgi:hypothetical protein